MGMNGNDKGSCCDFFLRDGEGDVKLGISSVNVGLLHPYVSYIYETLCKISLKDTRIILDL